MTTKRQQIDVPEHLTATAAAFYREVCESYELERHHRDLLQLAAEALAESERCQDAIRREGLTIEDRFGHPQPHPLLKIGQNSRGQFERLVRALGLDLDAPSEPYRQPAVRGRR